MTVNRNIFPTIGSKKRLKPWIIEGLPNWITPNFDRQLLLAWETAEKILTKNNPAVWIFWTAICSYDNMSGTSDMTIEEDRG